MKGPNVKEIRLKLGMTQVEFSNKFGLDLGTLQGWEQGRFSPSGPARVLLLLIERAPSETLRTLSAA